MDNNESGGVYAAEKIIRKRYKKVTIERKSKCIKQLRFSTIQSKLKIGGTIVYVFNITQYKYIHTWVHCRHLFLIKCFEIKNFGFFYLCSIENLSDLMHFYFF